MKNYFFDLHLHSCLSPCGSEDMTPSNLAAMCALAGYDIVALTDHNTVGNCAAFCRAAERRGLLALPGMELTTAEEVHVVCLFADLGQAQAFSELVRSRLPRRNNIPEFFGHQLLMDENDCLLGEETAMLAGASDIGLHETAGLVRSYSGVAYPAHIDRDSFSVLSNLGFWDHNMGFPLAELSRQHPPELLLRPDLADLRFITASDAHYLDQIPDPDQTMPLPEKTAQAVLDWLQY